MCYNLCEKLIRNPTQQAIYRRWQEWCLERYSTVDDYIKQVVLGYGVEMGSASQKLVATKRYIPRVILSSSSPINTTILCYIGYLI